MNPEQALQMICLAAEQMIPISKMREYQAAYETLLALAKKANAANAPTVETKADE